MLNMTARDAALIVGANAIPLLGVLLAGWDAFTVLMLFWLESAVIGIWVCVAVAISRQGPLEIQGMKGPPVQPGIGTALFILAHAGIFMLVHMFFLMGFNDIEGGGPDGFFNPVATIGNQLIGHGLWLPLAGLFVLRGLITVSDHVADRRLEPIVIGFYVRIILMQLAILFGGFFVILIGGTVAPLILLIILRVAIDVGIEPIVERLGLKDGPASAEAS